MPGPCSGIPEKSEARFINLIIKICKEIILGRFWYNDNIAKKIPS